MSNYTAATWLLEYLSVSGSHRRGRTFQCPAHEDGSPSLSVTEGEDGRALVFCHGPCTTEEVMSALGLGVHYLFDPPWTDPQQAFREALIRPSYAPVSTKGSPGKRAREEKVVGRTEHVYIPDRVVLVRLRLAGGGKRPYWRSSSDGKTWRNDLGGRSAKNLPLYREAEVMHAKERGDTIILCESESSVDALFAEGLVATTWAGGAKHPVIHRLIEVLSGANVIWIPDNDDAGLKCSQVIETELAPYCSMRTITPGPGQDARDLLSEVGPSVILSSPMAV